MVVRKKPNLIFGTPIRLDSAMVQGKDFLECWKWLLNHYANEEDPESYMKWVVFSLWRIWKSRNCLVFERKIVKSMEAIMLLRKRWCESEDLKKGEVPCIDKVQRRRGAPVSILLPTSWVRPHFRTIKVNYDVAWIKESGRRGFGGT